MAEYIKQEVPDMQGTGESRVSYRLKRGHHYTGSEFMAEVRRANPHLSAEVKSAVDLMCAQLARLMAQGDSVTIDGLGTFSATLGMKRGKEVDSFEEGAPRRNATSLCIDGVNFRPDKELVKVTDQWCTLTRGKTRRLRRVKTTPEQRLEMAKKYLRTHPFMSVRDYVYMTGLSRTVATAELVGFREDPATGITFTGLGTHKLYVLRQEGRE